MAAENYEKIQKFRQEVQEKIDNLLGEFADGKVSREQFHALYAHQTLKLQFALEALRSGDLATFGKIVEDEAMTLHALMMCSNPSYTLLRPNTLSIIEKVRDYRTTTGHPVYFTLDAGPNVHLLYPGDIIHEVRAFIEDELKEYCEDGYVQQDWVGEGPEEI